MCLKDLPKIKLFFFFNNNKYKKNFHAWAISSALKKILLEDLARENTF